MKVVFFGTPDFAIPTFEALIKHKDINVITAVTQPDKPAGRGQKLHSPPVKQLAEKHGILVFQPERLGKAQEVVEALRKIEPDLIVMVAFGQILKKDVLTIPKHGIINLHASLLPAYRGAAPINWALINGDTTAGATTMFTEAGLDTGPMLLKKEVSLDLEINAQQLAAQLSIIGAQLTIETIEQLIAGTLKTQPQDDSKATYAPLLTKKLGQINWSCKAKDIHNLVRGLIPWPLAFTTFRDNPIKIWRTGIVNAQTTIQLNDTKITFPGSLTQLNRQLFVCCGQNTWLEIKEIQPTNKPKLSTQDWINGAHIKANEAFIQ